MGTFCVVFLQPNVWIVLQPDRGTLRSRVLKQFVCRRAVIKTAPHFYHVDLSGAEKGGGVGGGGGGKEGASHYRHARAEL